MQKALTRSPPAHRSTGERFEPLKPAEEPYYDDPYNPLPPDFFEKQSSVVLPVRYRSSAFRSAEQQRLVVRW
jgi:hypothetical protein